MKRSLAATVIVAGVCILGANVGWAQSKTGFCEEAVTVLCGAANLDMCFSDQQNWNNLPNECLGDVQTMLETERHYNERPGDFYAQGDDYCAAAMTNMCGPGQSITDCLTVQGWSRVPRQCEGDFQTAVEMEREYYEEQGRGYSQPYMLSQGYSYGGHLRAGPGTEYRSLGMLADGDYLDIMEDSGFYYLDFPWFYVRTAIGDGYHWGGIICSDVYVDGIHATC
jgi:hypothetical protein